LPRLSVIFNAMVVTNDALMPISKCLYTVDVESPPQNTMLTTCFGQDCKKKKKKEYG